MPAMKSRWLSPTIRKDASQGERRIPFSREFVDRARDFEEIPPPGFKRLTVGVMCAPARRRIIRCDEAVKDAGGNMVELCCTLDPGLAPRHGRRQMPVRAAPSTGSGATRRASEIACTTACSPSADPDSGPTARYRRPASARILLRSPPATWNRPPPD